MNTRELPAEVLAAMEPHISPLVAEFNAIGLNTDSCCEGHLRKPPSPSKANALKGHTQVKNYPWIQFGYNDSGSATAHIAALLLQKIAWDLDLRLTELNVSGEIVTIKCSDPYRMGADLSREWDFIQSASRHLNANRQEFQVTVDQLWNSIKPLFRDKDEEEG